MPKSILEQIQRDGLEAQKREATAEVVSVNVEERTAEFSLSSEYEVPRWWGVEILGHKQGEVDLSRLNDGGAFLNMHNPYDQRGVVIKAWLGDDARCYCIVKFSRSNLGEELLQDFADGIRTQISVGYRIHELILEKQEGDLEYYRATKWEPTEVSSVSIAADPSVGVGRSAELQPQHAAENKILNPVNIRGMSAMDNELENEIETSVDGQRSEGSKKPVDKPAPRVQIVEERNEAADIAQTAAQYGAAELGNQFISQGRSLEEFKGALLKQLSEKRDAGKQDKDMSTALHLDLPESDLRAYSLMNVVRGLASGNLKKHAGLEVEISNAMAERADKDAHGIFVPHQVLGHGMRSMNAGTPTKGQEMISTDLLSDQFIEALRQKAVLGGLGARFLTGLQGNVDLPKQTGTATFYWLANEDDDGTDSDLALATVQMTPRTVAGSVPITRRMMIQTGGGIESLVRSDLLTGLASAMDAEGLATILAAAGVGAVDMTGGIDWAKVVEFESDVGESNYTGEMLQYLARASMIGQMKTTVKAAGTSDFLVEGGMCNGYPIVRHNGMLNNDLLFGDFSNLMYGLWGTVDLTIDKSTKAASGGTVLRVFQDADTAIRHEAAFSYGNTP